MVTIFFTKFPHSSLFFFTARMSFIGREKWRPIASFPYTIVSRKRCQVTSHREFVATSRRAGSSEMVSSAIVNSKHSTYTREQKYTDHWRACRNYRLLSRVLLWPRNGQSYALDSRRPATRRQFRHALPWPAHSCSRVYVGNFCSSARALLKHIT